jgi:serine carboxypeptidase-like clade 1
MLAPPPLMPPPPLMLLLLLLLTPPPLLLRPTDAGIYVPKLAQQILSHAAPTVMPQLKGFAVGDGCLGTESGVCGGGPVWWHLLFLYGHGQISSLLYDEIVSTCGFDYLKKKGVAPPGCSDALSRVAAEAGGYFAYSLYDDCIYSEGVRRRRRRLQAQSRGDAASPLAQLGFEVDEAGRAMPVPARAKLGDHNSPTENNYKCVGDSTVLWSNASSVRVALHVPVDSYFFNGDNGEGMTYHLTEKNLMPFYQEVAKSTKLRVLIYNGDTDPSIDSFMAQNWTTYLGFTPTQPWRPWTLDGCRRMGGYVTRYQERFDYLTIRGSGHMVPQYKPEPAFEFLKQWIGDEDYKPYVKGCKAPPPAERRGS